MKAACFVIGEATLDNTLEYDPLKYGTVGKDVMSDPDNNVIYGSHSYGLHKEVDNVKMINALSKEELDEDVKKMNSIGDFKYLSYPFNTDTKEMIEVLKNNNYKLAFRGESEMVSKKVNLYQIPRIGVNNDMNDFKKKILTDEHKNRYGNGIIRKVMIKIERTLKRRVF